MKFYYEKKGNIYKKRTKLELHEIIELTLVLFSVGYVIVRVIAG